MDAAAEHEVSSEPVTTVEDKAIAGDVSLLDVVSPCSVNKAAGKHCRPLLPWNVGSGSS